MAEYRQCSKSRKYDNKYAASTSTATDRAMASSTATDANAIVRTMDASTYTFSDKWPDIKMKSSSNRNSPSRQYNSTTQRYSYRPWWLPRDEETAKDEGNTVTSAGGLNHDVVKHDDDKDKKSGEMHRISHEKSKDDDVGIIVGGSNGNDGCGDGANGATEDEKPETLRKSLTARLVLERSNAFIRKVINKVYDLPKSPRKPE